MVKIVVEEQMIIVNNDADNINSYIKEAVSFELIDNNKISLINKQHKDFNILLNKILSAFEDSLIMPALGVSFNDDVLEDLKTGQFIKINFDKQYEINGLPFTALLFKLDEAYGLNLIREFNNRFDGRCIYLNLNKLTNLKNILKNK